VWVVGIIGLMLFCHASHKKMLINLLVAKGLFEAYTIVVKNVQERDALDLALPYLTLFQRIFLADYVFAVLFTMIGQYLLSESEGKRAQADLRAFGNRMSEAGVAKQHLEELEGIAKTVGLIQSKRED
jgi:hypothetical protein